MWVARDKDGSLWLHDVFPYRNRAFDEWNNSGDLMSLDAGLFPDLKWESDPLEIELKAVQS
jgi:hypothetical protein